MASQTKTAVNQSEANAPSERAMFDRDPLLRSGFRAIKKGDWKTLQRLLKKNEERLRTDLRFGASFASFSVRMIHLSPPVPMAELRRCFDVLIAFGVPVHRVEGAIDMTPLECAVAMPDLTIARELIELGADPLEENALGWPLTDIADPRVRDEVEEMVRAAERKRGSII